MAGDASLDLLVVGSGVAGLSAAVRAAEHAGMRVGVVTKGDLAQSATRWAQGGVAAVLGQVDDTTDVHLADTLRAGAGFCDRDAVRVLVDDGPRRLQELVALGARFDRRPDGDFERAREGGHSRARVVHAGGAATGAEIERALVEAVQGTAAQIFEHHITIRLIVEAGRCRGVVVLGPDGLVRELRAAHVVLATGGAGQLFAVTTNPRESTGDGIAIALAARVAVADVEFMQFHPTALHHPAMPRPLLSEAIRGDGAVLRDLHGQRFVEELLPRDQVARAMAARMLEQSNDHCWLDATGLESFADRYPTIAQSLALIGLDPSVDWLPVAPAAHYLSGGIVTDLHGATTLPGLWACGEVACTGVHGANRLASNSLLEGMVFAPRVVEAIAAGRDGPESSGAMRGLLDGASSDAVPFRQLQLHVSTPGAVATCDLIKARELLQRAMTAGAGVVRSAATLGEAEVAVRALAGTGRAPVDSAPQGGDAIEVDNLVRVALALITAALARHETRGAHSRSDFPGIQDALRCRLVFS